MTPGGSSSSASSFVVEESSTWPPCPAAPMRAAGARPGPRSVPAELGLARVQAHAHLDLHPFGPGVRRQVALRIDGRGQCVGGRAEGDEERVALRVDDASLVSGEGGTQKLRMLGENLVVAVAPQPLEQGRRALDIGEDESDSARRKFMHRAHIFVQAGQKS